MSKTVSLTIPDNLYDIITKIAKNKGQTSESLIMECVENSFASLENDPLEPFIGIIDTQGSDWSEKHDQYLGQALLDNNNNQ